MSGFAEEPSFIPPRYKVERELGRGGMGRVVAAFDTTIRRRVAIKIAPAPPPGDIEQQKAFQRFRREAQLAGGLQHRNIVGIYDFGADAQTAWMVMEIVEGGSLRDLLQRTEVFSLADTARIMVELLDGLAFCHDQGIVHCDVKPANIMLTEPSVAGEVKLADFGIARNFGRAAHSPDDGEATQVLSASAAALPDRIGTPSHMAPEQFTGGPLDQRTDIWAAGVVLYHLLTRENPFTGHAEAIEMKVMGSEPTPPSQISVLATRAFDDLIRKALAKNPKDRFQDARSFAAALLEATRARRSGSMPRPTTPEQPPARPKNVVRIASAAGGVAALAGLAAFLLMPGTPPPPPSAAPARLAQPAPEARPPTMPPPAPGLAQLPAATPTPPLLLVPPPPPAPQLQPGLVQPAPAPFPGPALIPAAPPVPSEAMIQAALASATDPQRCALLDVRRDGSVVTLAGFVHQREVAGLEQRLQAAGLTPHLQAEVFDAPFCELLAALRPIMAAAEAPRLAARSTRIRGGERLTLDFDMGQGPTTVSLWFVMHDGQALRLLGDHRLAPGERRMMNETNPEFPWVIADPFGHELVIMLASDGPSFRTPRPLEETMDSLTEALRETIRRAQGDGRRLVARAIMVHTRP